jgi:MFS family permease
VLPLLASGLRIDPADLGIVLGSFLVGAGIFQIPAGLAAVRWGNRPVSVAALGLMGVFALASAFSPNWYVLAALRFGTGAGAAFFFAPALGLVASYYPHGTRGPIIGLYNSGFSLGAAIGIFAGALVGSAFGWPWALGVGGVALLAIAAVSAWALPPSPPVRLPGRGELFAAARPVLRSRPLWSLALALTGIWAAFFIVAQYFVEFAATVHPGWSIALAASLPTVMILLEVLGGPVGGWLGERRGSLRGILLIFGVPSAVGVALVPYLPLFALVPLFVFLGFAEGVVFAVLYLLPSYLPEVGADGLSLALALLNAVQIFLGSAVAIVFGFVAAQSGYNDAWLLAGAVGLVTLPLLLGVSGGGPAGVPAPAPPAPRPHPPA